MTRRHRLIVETEEGFAAALIWDVDDALKLPATGVQFETQPEQQRI